LKEEIDKLEGLSVIKDDEIANLDMEIRSLKDFLATVKDTQQEKISAYSQEIDHNKKVIRRQDKMIVDLQQRNEVSMQQVAVT
jgi:hypothetical protein